MVGPDRSVHGGISAVVNNYYDAGLDQKIGLCYIGTMIEGSKLRKLIRAVEAFALFCVKVPGYQIVHVNMASDSSDVTPEGAYTCSEITAIIQTFPEDYREPFNMHVAGYKYEEIAEKLNMPMGTVKSRIFFTRQRLRAILKDYR